MNRSAILAFAAAVTIGGSALAQHSPHLSGHTAGSVETTKVAPAGAFAVRVYGAFRNFMQRQDYSGKVALPDVRGSGTTEAVGALSGLRGEITFVDGVPIVSYGGCATCKLKHGETAALLGTATVRQWVEAAELPSDLKGADLDNFILAAAGKAGINTAAPFPVRLIGTLSSVEMHVIEAPNAGFTGHGSKVHMAKQDEFRHDRINGLVVGFFAPPSMQGALTHPGEPFHYHWVAEDRSRTAHLDAFVVQKGGRLFLPK
jgi:alpha-acetolactate decarboxylase